MNCDNISKKTQVKSPSEEGFILISVIIILAILTIIGTVLLMKSKVQTQVSATSVVAGQALAAASAGLAENYAYWAYDSPAGAAEKDAVVAAASAGTAVSGIYSQAASGTTAIPTDAAIQGSLTGYRVYNVTAAGMAGVPNAQWATVNTPQVAVWATRFNKQAPPAYPYISSPLAGACSDCNVAVYSLGRSGIPGGNDSRKMLREIQLSATSQLEGVSAMTNAPAYATWQDACDGAHHAIPVGGKDKKGDTPTPVTTPSYATIDWLIEATQAEYVLKKSPSGVAFASNTSTGPGEKSFRKGKSTTTVATMDSDPMIVYSGHGATSGARANLLSTTLDGTGANLPDPNLPSLLVSQPLLASTPLDYFDPADPNKQLFNLDAYRWAAEQFTCNGAASGAFCAKAEALRLAVDALPSYVATAPVSGRLSLAEFEYNVAKGIPMFGMVRVMYPVYYQASLGTCANYKGGTEAVLAYDTATPTTGLYVGGAYDGSATKLDGDGKLGPKAKLIVYGSILYDFFTDMDGNGFFDPSVSVASGTKPVYPDGKPSKTALPVTVYEHLVTPFEAVDARMELELMDTVNPGLHNAAAPTNFPTANAAGTITIGSSAKPVNLASPTSGWFPNSEGMLPVSANQIMGEMDLMKIVGGANGKAQLNVLADKMKVAGGLTGAAKTYANTLFTNAAMHARLDYYYQLMHETAKKSDANSWPMDDFPATMNDSFCIGSEDCTTSNTATMTNNDGDKFHLLAPSGYMHGWKVALAALDMKAADWNALLTGTVGLAATHSAGNAGYGYDWNDVTYPKGSPFNMKAVAGVTIDVGASRTAELTLDQGRYFYVDGSDPSGYGLMTSAWKDIPAQMYAGGLVDIHHVTNISGVTYTPGPLEWETGNNSLTLPPTGYFNGAIITGFGAFMENKGKASAVLVYDNQSVDNLSVNTTTIVMRRYAREGL